MTDGTGRHHGGSLARPILAPPIGRDAKYGAWPGRIKVSALLSGAQRHGFRRVGKGAERRAHADCIDALVQFITSVLMRLGTSPTGTTAFTVMLCVSIAVTDLIAALEM